MPAPLLLKWMWFSFLCHCYILNLDANLKQKLLPFYDLLHYLILLTINVQRCLDVRFILTIIQNLEKLMEQLFKKNLLPTKHEPVHLSDDVVSLSVPGSIPGWKVSADRTTRVREYIHVFFPLQPLITYSMQ